MGGKTGKGRRGMGGWGWIAEAKLQEKGEPGEQQISAGEGNGVPGEGSCCSCGGGGGRWEPVVPALPAPDLCPPGAVTPRVPSAPAPMCSPRYRDTPACAGSRRGCGGVGGKGEEEVGGPNVKRFKINQSRVWQ